MIGHPQNITEIEQLVFKNRPADIPPQIVISQVADARVKKRARIELAILQKFVDSAVDLIGSRFEDDVHHRAASPA